MSTISVPTSDQAPSPSNFKAYASRVIRVVEAQHKISTSRLAAGLLEEEILEQYVEKAKPTIPPEARGLHRLLATPFRFGYRKETRFRRAYERPGVFYASERCRTALAEQAYWFMRFHRGTRSLLLPTGTIEYWAFSIAVKAERGLDLVSAPFNASWDSWTDPDGYARCQEFAARARAIDAQLIRYESVRDRERGANIALFDPSAFREKVPKEDSSWHFRFHGDALIVFGAFPSGERYDFTFEQFGLTRP